jgi:ubiquinone/menaquinone biosynthesis C-methylase UbiE
MSTSKAFQETKDQTVSDKATGLQMDFVAYCKEAEEDGFGLFEAQKERVWDIMWRFLMTNNNSSTTRVMDIGCAIGTDLRHWRRRAAASQNGNDSNVSIQEWHGIDIMSAMVDAAKDMSPEMHFQWCDVHDMSCYEADFFDAVHCSRVLFHSRDMTKALEEMTRIVKPGGRCFCRRRRHEQQQWYLHVSQ